VSTECKAVFVESCAQNFKPAWGSAFSKLSIVVSLYTSTCPQARSHGVFGGSSPQILSPPKFCWFLRRPWLCFFP